jgi:putative transposase
MPPPAKLRGRRLGQEVPGDRPELGRAWGEVTPFYAFPGDVRRILYTTNAIEALNSKLRRAVRARGHFPSDEAATKLLFLVLNRSEKEWIMPPREWCMAKAQFAVLFGERFTRAMA